LLISAAVIAVLIIVYVSYRQTIAAYPTAHVSKLALRKSFRGASRTAETTIGGLEVPF
jgi:hypothetical protein